MFGTASSQLLKRVAAGTPECRNRSERRSSLRPEHFPVQADGRDIVAQDGTLIAVTADAAMSEEIVRRLNKTDWNDQEDQWAL
jgi:hypothetical protein